MRRRSRPPTWASSAATWRATPEIRRGRYRRPPRRERHQLRVHLAVLPGHDLDLQPPRAIAIEPDLDHVVARLDLPGTIIRPRLARSCPDRRVVEPHEPAGRIAIQIEAGVGRRFQDHAPGERLAGADLDDLVAAHVAVTHDGD